MSFSIPIEVEYVLKSLTDAGYEAYLVGGCVRDFIMGVVPKDYDVTTNARPEEIHRVFEEDVEKEGAPHLVDTGIKQGTVTVIKNHRPVEVTTYRTESRYSDGRHPDQVLFSHSIEADLARRDFTMNAIAYKPDFLAYKQGEGIFVDPFDGMVDIANKRIKCVGNPDDRFGEDALRIMRALRFASQLGFDIEEGTRKGFFDKKDSLNKISRERIQKELEGILCGDNVEKVLRDYSEVIAVIIPEILPMVGFNQHNSYHIYDVWEHTIRVVSGVPAEAALRLAALFHDIGKPSSFTLGADGTGHFYGHPEVSLRIVEKIMSRLKFDNETKNTVLSLVRWHDLRPEPTEKSVRKTLAKLGSDLFDGWISIKRADNWAQAPKVADRQAVIDQIEEIGHRLIDMEGVMSIKTLDITGKDLMEMGLPQGPEIGAALNLLLNKVLEGELNNEKEVLKAYIAGERSL